MPTALNTGGITVSAATLEPAVSWALGAVFHAPVPESVAVLVTGIIAAGAHQVIAYLQSRNAAPQ